MIAGAKRPGDAVVEMSKLKVNVKWGKEAFNDIEVDLEQSPMVFKSQLFTLSGVPPDRQKVMIKGGLLKDDEWGKQVPKEGATIMLMGSADAKPVEAPKDVPKFVEDLPESEQNSLETKAYGSGLQNLGNTCYMNSTVQCLYAIEPLRAALTNYKSSAGYDLSAKLTAATKELFSDLQQGGEAFAPYKFLLTLREKFPQFGQTGEGGTFMQQDAEECWTNLVYTLREKVQDGAGSSLPDQLLGVGTRLKLTCEESGEEFQEDSKMYMLKCNISQEVNHLHEGLLLGLKDDRERHSEKLGRTALFKGSSVLTSLPEYLTVQMVRFFYKVEVRQKAKVLRKVSYPLELDVYDLCSPDLKAQLDPPRAALKAWKDEQVEAAKRAKGAAAKSAAGGEAQAADSSAAPAAPPGGDVEMSDAAAAGPSSSSSSSLEGALTGKFELCGVLTHKGRSADSGHYVAWIKQKDGRWVLFDDDTLTFKKDEEILALCGGGDWHMAYLLLYRAVKVPAGAPAPAAATGSGATA
mmetsp:Transcript_38368/g.85421  ORF Transcript_38368/g.85421 Transcript_38368/m.85421 type:complete len:521 (+) Transcript_38368:65-1627(+)